VEAEFASRIRVDGEGVELSDRVGEEWDRELVFAKMMKREENKVAIRVLEFSPSD
jgi:hypothetical protein